MRIRIILILIVVFQVFKKNNAITPRLTNSWMFTNSSYADSVAAGSLINGFQVSFAPDRFGNANSALYLNGGYIQIPPGCLF